MLTLITLQVLSWKYSQILLQVHEKKRLFSTYYPLWKKSLIHSVSLVLKLWEACNPPAR